MNKTYFKIAVAVFSLFIIFPLSVNAESIINSKGVTISEEEYNDFIKMYSHAHIMTMDEDEYERLLTLNYDNVITENKYVATTYNPSLGLTTETELTEEQYENFIVPEAGLENIYDPNLNSGSASLETTAKQLTMAFAAGSYWHGAVLTASWKYIPTTRVFDVIGFNGSGFIIRNGSQSGTQMYIDANGDYQDISYSWNGTNIKRFDNGYGISMNLVNQTIQALVLDTYCDLRAELTHPSLMGSYQHAINNSVTLAQSQNYTLGPAGLGSVFVYPYNISAKYDGMNGLQIDF